MMVKRLRYLIIAVAVLFVIAQFFQPELNKGDAGENHLFSRVSVPGEIENSLKDACMDCHSNQTNYHWYHRIAPVSWLIANHIREGKQKLNFSDWGKFSKIDQITYLDHINKEVSSGEMPLKSYSFIHKKARLTKAQKDSISSWSEKLAFSLLGEKQ